jgi:glucan biosynthesis protein
MASRRVAFRSAQACRAARSFPIFREFWVETPAADAERITVYALLDSPSVAGAYRFHIYPDGDSVVDVGAALFPRKRSRSSAWRR